MLRPGGFIPGKGTQFLRYRVLGGPRGQSGWIRKIPPPPGIEPRSFQPVASDCTSYAIPAPFFYHRHQRNLRYLKVQFVPRSKQSSWLKRVIYRSIRQQSLFVPRSIGNTEKRSVGRT